MMFNAKNEMVPLDPEKEISPLLYLNLITWIYIAAKLPFSDKISLRLVSRFFLRAVSSTRAWEQWVNVNELKTFQKLGEALGWENRPIYGLFYPTVDIISQDWHTSLNFPIKELDLSSYQPNDEEENKKFLQLLSNLPKGLEVLTLHFSTYITQDLIEFLLRQYPELYIDFQGASLLFWACYFGWSKTVKNILNQIKQEEGPFSEIDIDEDGNGFYNPLAIAAQQGHVNIIKLLLKSNIQIDFGGEGGVTPLIAATEQGNFNVVKLLLENGAYVNDSGETDQTPLTVTQIYTAKQNKDIIAKLLITYDASYAHEPEDKIDLLESFVESYNNNKEKFLQAVHKSNPELPQLFQINTKEIPSKKLLFIKEWIYKTSRSFTKNQTRVRTMAHTVSHWLEYIITNKFSFSLMLSPKYIKLYCICLFDVCLNDIEDLRELWPTEYLLNIQLEEYDEDEVYRLHSEIKALNLSDTVSISSPLDVLKNLLSILPQTSQIKNIALFLLDSYNLQVFAISKNKDKLAAAIIAVTRFWLLEKKEEAWPQEYAEKTNIPFISFQAQFNEIRKIAQEINQKRLTKATEAKTSQTLNPSSDFQLATHPATFFSEANAQIIPKSESTDDEYMILGPYRQN